MSPPVVWLFALHPALLGFWGVANHTPEAATEFNRSVAQYVALHKRAEHNLPTLKPKSTPSEIAARNERLAQAIQASRADAQQGNIFTPAVQAYFLRVLQTELKGKGGKAARATARDGNPKGPEHPVKVVVEANARYPKEAPVSTMPPTLLLRLPQLPKEVEYRFVGRDLILLDVSANLIVDFIPNAVPQT